MGTYVNVQPDFGMSLKAYIDGRLLQYFLDLHAGSMNPERKTCQLMITVVAKSQAYDGSISRGSHELLKIGFVITD